MEFIIELILEVIGAIWEDSVKNPRIPKIVRTVIILLLGIPVCGFIWLLAYKLFAEDKSVAGGVVLTIIGLFLTGMFAVLIFRVWRKRM